MGSSMFVIHGRKVLLENAQKIDKDIDLSLNLDAKKNYIAKLTNCIIIQKVLLICKGLILS